MGDEEERGRFLTQVKKACRIGRKLRDLEMRDYGVIRIDSAASPAEWAKDPEENTKRIAQTFREACAIAEDSGERLAAEGEICWAGMHSWRRNRANCWKWWTGRKRSDFRPTWRTPCSSPWATTRRRTGCCRKISTGRITTNWRRPIAKWRSALRPWTIDFHVAQNDGTVKGSGSHDKTGRHCQPLDPNGKLDIVRDAGAWMRDDNGQVDPRVRSISAGMAACFRIR